MLFHDLTAVSILAIDPKNHVIYYKRSWTTDLTPNKFSALASLRIRTQPVGRETSLQMAASAWATRRPLCDAIANGVLQVSDVREAGKVVIYKLRSGTLYCAKEYSGWNSA